MMPDEAESLDGLREDPIVQFRVQGHAFAPPTCQHCGAMLYDGTYKVVLEDGSLSRETYCSHCDKQLWTTRDPEEAGT